MHYILDRDDNDRQTASHDNSQTLHCNGNVQLTTKSKKKRTVHSKTFANNKPKPKPKQKYSVGCVAKRQVAVVTERTVVDQHRPWLVLRWVTVSG